MWLLRRLLKYACTQGLAQLAAYVLPVALRGSGGVPALLAACAASPAGWSLLHLAVASGSQATVEVLHQEPRCLYRQLMCHEHAFPQHGQCKRHGTFAMSVWSISSRNPSHKTLSTRSTGAAGAGRGAGPHLGRRCRGALGPHPATHRGRSPGGRRPCTAARQPHSSWCASNAWRRGRQSAPSVLQRLEASLRLNRAAGIWNHTLNPTKQY